MESFHTETHVAPDGTVLVANVPFPKGERVHIYIVKEKEGLPSPSPRLKDSLVRYEDPFGPAAEWDAAQ